MNNKYSITGIGLVSPIGLGFNEFTQALKTGKNGISEIESFSTEKFGVKLGGEIKNLDPKALLGPKGLRNLDRSALFLMSATKMALDDAKLEINAANTDNVGVCTGTTFAAIGSIIDFDRELIKEGLDFTNPALFPSTVINAASSQVSIRFNIQGFNVTISTGYTSSIEAIKYSLDALETKKTDIVLCGAVETLVPPTFFGFYKMGYMAGLNGIAQSCPYDKRRNGPILGEAAVMFCIEEPEKAKLRGAKTIANISGIGSFFDAFKIGRIHPQGEGLEKAITKALDQAGLDSGGIDYISSCANSSQDLDKVEVKVLKRIFGSKLNKIPVSATKSMLGETLSAAGALQITSCVAAMQEGFVPPTINYKEKDPECDIDCVPNKAQAKKVNNALVVSFGPGGYSSAAIVSKYQ